MKSRNLKTTYDLIVSNYRIEPLENGKFLHSFTPASTDTVYQFIANGTSELEEGMHYNVGYSDGDYCKRDVDLSCISKASDVNPTLSYLFARQLSSENSRTNKAKNDERVTHKETSGYYWGKKYAWREYGLAISKGAFYKYLKEIEHPSTPCLTINPDLPYANNEQSTAYLDDGLLDSIEQLIMTAEKVTKAMYKSPLYSKRFAIDGLTAISDKK
jgi:hypothetical protein